MSEEAGGKKSKRQVSDRENEDEKGPAIKVLET